MSNKEVPSEVEIESITNCNDIKIGISDVSESILQLLGEVLTIIDAAIGDKQQNKAVKDLIKSRFYSRNGNITKYAVEKAGIDWVEFTTPPESMTEEELLANAVTEEEMLKAAGADPSHI